jgi:quinol monooxygenase YgiN
MRTLVIWQAHIKPGYWERASQEMAKNLPDTRNFEGCQEIICYAEHNGKSFTDFIEQGPSQDDARRDEGGTMMLIEYWDSLEAYHKYVTWRKESGAVDEFLENCDAPAILRTFDEMEM